MSSRGKGPTKTRPARSSSLDGSVYTVSSSSSVSSISTIPSIEVSESGEESSTWQNSQSVPSVVDVDEEPLPDEEHQTSKVSVDRERQLLLLFLLAQVCALHDPTPRTFTVHVLGLFEQGILDRESIQFLFDLGFVPSTTVDSRGLLITNGTTSAPARAPVNSRIRKRPKEDLAVVTDERITSDIFIEDDDPEIEYLNSSRDMTTEIATTTELAIAGPTNVLHHVDSAVPGVTTLHSNQTLRSLEASSIRERLSQHESSDKNKKKSSKKTTTGEPNSPVANRPPKSWDAANFPLSMSRYEREFKDITPLSSGSFGSVFRARRELDGHEYAVKKITFDEMGYSNESIDQVIREVQCLAAVNDHPNVVRYYTSWWEPTWMTGSIPSKNNQKHIENGNHSKASRKRFLQIEAGEANDKSEYSASSYSSSSSSSSSSDSDDDYYSLDGGTRSVEESTWESYRSHSVEPWNNAYDDSYMTKTEYRSRRRSARQSKKNSQTTTPYQYQISLYIQMQLCHPANLQDWIRERNKRIPESDHEQRIGPAVEIFQQICGGLAHIHSANVVHRDLKPANIFVSSDGKAIKIGDFGLSKKLKDLVNQQKSTKFDAKAPSSPQKSATAQPESYAITPFRPGISSIQALVERNKVGKNLTSGIGTASYAAPEQVQSKTYGTAVDIFSLGLIFLELVSCFETEHERLHNLQQCRFRNLPKWLDENYPEISSTILACTNPKACDRPSASELIDAAKIQSPRNQNEVHKLKRQLAEKNRIIAEKDEFIENMRFEMAKLHELLVQMKSGACVHQNGEQTPSKKNEKDDIIVTDVLTFDDDVE